MSDSPELIVENQSVRDSPSMIAEKQLIDALAAYRARLIAGGHPAKAAAVAHCMAIVRRLMK